LQRKLLTHVLCSVCVVSSSYGLRRNLREGVRLRCCDLPTFCGLFKREKREKKNTRVARCSGEVSVPEVRSCVRWRHVLLEMFSLAFVNTWPARGKIKFIAFINCMARDSSDGIATRYGLDGPGIESPVGGEIFPHPSGPVLGPTQPPIQ
jgi:hypothetical protein